MSPGTPCTRSFTCYCTNFGGSFGGVQSPNGSKALCAIHAKCARASLATSAGTVGELAHPAQWIAQSTCIQFRYGAIGKATNDSATFEHINSGKKRMDNMKKEKRGGPKINPELYNSSVSTPDSQDRGGPGIYTGDIV